MNTIILPAESSFELVASKALAGAAVFWFLVTLCGLWFFAFYILSFYGGSALGGDWQRWSEVLPKGILAGDHIGNAALSAHLLLAFIIIFAAPLQLIPQIRQRYPTFHRWNGRIYLPLVVIASIAGLWLVWTRKADDDLMQNLGISLDAILILVFALLALRFALARNFMQHRRWALRLFLVVNAVWFFRIGLMLWLMIHQGPVGIDFETFSGPFLSFLAFAQTLLPLAVLQLYFSAQISPSAVVKFSTAGLLVVLTLAMAAGIIAATLGLWLPRL